MNYSKQLQQIASRVTEYVPRDGSTDQSGRTIIDSYLDLLVEAGKQNSLDSDLHLSNAAYLENPVFICGMQKSGTNLLRNLLDSHKSLVVLPSDGLSGRILSDSTPEFSDSVRHFLKRLLEPLAGSPPNWILSEKAGDYKPYLELSRLYFAYFRSNQNSIVGCCKSIVSAYSQSSGRNGFSFKYWVEKTPKNSRNIETLLNHFPPARFIQIIRNPLAVTASISKKMPVKKRKFDLQSHIYLADLIMKTGQDNLKRLGTSRYKIVFYEDLTTRTEETMRSICEFLDIEFDKNLLVPTVNGIPARSNTSFKEKEFDFGEVSSATKDEWRRYWKRSEIIFISTLLYKASANYGFHLRKYSLPAYLLAAIKIKWNYRNKSDRFNINLTNALKDYCRFVLRNRA